MFRTEVLAKSLGQERDYMDPHVPKQSIYCDQLGIPAPAQSPAPSDVSQPSRHRHLHELSSPHWTFMVL